MSLHTGKRIHGYKWQELPLDEHVVERVELMTEQEEQPIMHRGLPCFEWALGVEMQDILEIEDERALTIANDGAQGAADEQELVALQPELGQIEDELPIDELDEDEEEEVQGVAPNNDDACSACSEREPTKDG